MRVPRKLSSKNEMSINENFSDGEKEKDSSKVEEVDAGPTS